MATAAWRSELSGEWQLATREHAFLRDVNAGAISAGRFNTWLAQASEGGRAAGRERASGGSAHALPGRRPGDRSRGSGGPCGVVNGPSTGPQARAAPPPKHRSRTQKPKPTHTPAGLPLRPLLLPPPGRDDRRLPRGPPGHLHRGDGRHRRGGGWGEGAGLARARARAATRTRARTRAVFGRTHASAPFVVNGPRAARGTAVPAPRCGVVPRRQGGDRRDSAGRAGRERLCGGFHHRPGSPPPEILPVPARPLAPAAEVVPSQGQGARHRPGRHR